MANPLALNSGGHQQELEPVALTNTLPDTTALAAYAGAVNQIVTADGMSWTYNSASTATADNCTIITATGKGSGRWISITAFRKNIADFGVVYGTGLATAQITANTAAFQKAFNSKRLLFYSDNFQINGLISTNGIPVSLVGSTLTAQIHQTAATGVFDCGVGSELFELENVNICPDVNVPTAYAIKVTGAGGNNPNINVKNVVVNHGPTVSNVTFVFEGGAFWFVNFGEGSFQDSKYFGRDKSIGYGLHVTNTVVSVSAIVTRFKVYGAARGANVFNSTNPGIEGMRFVDCDFVTCDYGIYGDGNATYSPPQFDIIGCHFNCFTRSIYIRKFSQFIISRPLIYLYNDGSQGAVGIDIDASSECTISCPKIYKVGIGAVNGIIVGATATDVSIADGFSRMQSGDAFAVIVAGATRVFARDNKAIGGMSFCVADNSGTAILDRNYLNGVLVGNNSNTITGNVKTVNVQSGDYTVLPNAANGTPDTNKTWHLKVIHHVSDANKRTLLLFDANDSRIFYIGLINTSDGTGFSGWTRPLTDTLDAINYVQGNSPISKASFITDVQADQPSGFYIYGSATNMPADPSGFNTWYILNHRFQDNATTQTPSFWACQTAINLKLGFRYERFRDQQTSTWSSWNSTVTTLTKAGAATTTDVPAGVARIVKDTSGGSVKLIYNDGGTLKSVTLA